MIEPNIDAWSEEEKTEFERAAREGIIPPTRLWWMVGATSDFYSSGRGLFDLLVTHGRTSPHSAVLDVGCGLGKTAIHFATYLQSPGFYEGFDIEKPSIDWCVKAISSRFPLMRFKHINLYSEMYNRSTGADASTLGFPYESSTFDLVFLASVFTHMFDAQLENYLREISRVLKPGGRCFATYYLLNDEKRAGIAAKTSAFTFSHPFRGSYIECLHPPEAAVAHEQARVHELVMEAGLTLTVLPRYGAWATSNVHDQDFVLTHKAG
jgi:SAM-dependent methyltransferase